jgi:predicted DNA-binding protein
LAFKARKTESEVLRDIIDQYIIRKRGKKLEYEPCKHNPIQGMKVHPRTIRKDQDKYIRRIAEKTGRTISEVVRDAVEGY